MKLNYFAICLFLFLSPLYVCGYQPKDLTSYLDEMIFEGKTGFDISSTQPIIDRIEHTTGVLTLLLPKIRDKNVDYKTLSVYLWAIYLSKDRNAIDDIIRLYNRTNYEELKWASLNVIAELGGPKAGQFLMEQLDKASEISFGFDDVNDTRFLILNCLSQMKYSKALPMMDELLKVNKSLLYKSQYIFGKMGDSAIPFLINKINDDDEKVRYNAIWILGMCLIANEAKNPFQEHFIKEPNKEVRLAIIDAFTEIVSNPEEQKQIFHKLLSQERDEQVLKSIHENIGNLYNLKREIKSFKESKKIDSLLFEKEYSKLYNSFGKEGNFNILEITSKPEDEEKLIKLRERVLQLLNGGELYYYEKINHIIIFNRYLKYFNK